MGAPSGDNRTGRRLWWSLWKKVKYNMIMEIVHIFRTSRNEQVIMYIINTSDLPSSYVVQADKPTADYKG